MFCASAPLSARLWTDIQGWAGTKQVVYLGRDDLTERVVSQDWFFTGEPACGDRGSVAARDSAPDVLVLRGQ